MNLFKKAIAYSRIKRAIDEAEEKFARTGDRQYVISWGSQLLVIDRPSFKFNKKKGNIPQKKTVMDLEDTAFYYTCYRDGSCVMDKDLKDKRLWNYYRWFAYTFRWKSVFADKWWYKLWKRLFHYSYYIS